MDNETGGYGSYDEEAEVCCGYSSTDEEDMLGIYEIVVVLENFDVERVSKQVVTDVKLYPLASIPPVKY